MKTVNGDIHLEIAFFDIDGVLSAPQYPDVNGGMTIGLTVEDWLKLCHEQGDETYRYCQPMPPVKEFAAGLKAEGTRLYVLSTCMSDDEPGAKRKFLDRYYPGLFDECVFVDEDPKKLPAIEEMAAAAGIRNQDCALIEDTYSTLWAAYVKGIIGIHLSNIIAGNISR